MGPLALPSPTVAPCPQCGAVGIALAAAPWLLPTPDDPVGWAACLRCEFAWARSGAERECAPRYVQQPLRPRLGTRGSAWTWLRGGSSGRRRCGLLHDDGPRILWLAAGDARVAAGPVPSAWQVESWVRGETPEAKAPEALRDRPERFDAIALDGVPEQADDPRRVLEAMRDLLQPNGVLVWCTSPLACSARRGRRLRCNDLADPSHRRPKSAGTQRYAWTLDGARALLRASGFEILRVARWGRHRAALRARRHR